MSGWISLSMFLYFYIAWFIIVLNAASVTGTLFLFFPLCQFLFLVSRKIFSMRSLLTISLISVLGISFDSFMVSMDVLSLVEQQGVVIPYWLMAIWFLFSISTIYFAPSLNKWSIAVAFILGAVFGPMSYKSGEYFSVLTFLNPFGLVFYSCFWALFFPLSLVLAKRVI